MTAARRSFRYEARSQVDSKRVRGTMVANDAASVRATLRSRNFLVSKIEEIDETKWWRRSFGGSTTPKLSDGQLAEFAGVLGRMLRAGIALPLILQTVADKQRKPAQRDLYVRLADDIQAGLSLGKALDRYPDSFPEDFRALVSAGERTGRLIESLDVVKAISKKKAMIRRKVKSALMYPKIIGGISLIVVVGILMFLVPRFASIYDEFGAQLPAPTRAVLWLSKMLVPIGGASVGPIPLLYPKLTSPTMWIIAAVVGYKIYVRRTAEDLDVGERLERLRWKFPTFGKLSSRQRLYQWSRTMAGAVRAEIPMVEAVMLAGRATGSRWHMKVAEEVSARLRNGERMSALLAEKEDLFPEFALFLEAGESAGDVASVLDEIAADLEEQIDITVEAIPKVLESIALIGVGGIVGVLLIAMYLPILSMATVAMEGLEEQHSTGTP